MNYAENLSLAVVFVAGLGVIYALRRQSQTFTIADNVGLQQRVEQLEAANRYLLQKMADDQRLHKLEIEAINKRLEMVQGLLWDSQQEARDRRRMQEELEKEVAGLRSALRTQ